MLRLCIFACLLVLAVPTKAFGASPPVLVGFKDSGPLRFLTKGLRVVKNTPRLPRGKIVFSPNARKVATWKIRGKYVTIRSARSGRMLERYPLRAGYDVLWPTRHHLLVVGQNRRGPEVRSVDLNRDRVNRVHVTGAFLDSYSADGRGLRLVAAPGPSGPRTVLSVGAAGRVKERFRVPARFGTTGTARGEVTLFTTINGPFEPAGDATLFDSAGNPQALPTDLDVFGFVADDLLLIRKDVTRPGVARIDPDTLTITDSVEFSAEGGFPPTPFRGGFVLGPGRARYDDNLDLVYTNEPGETATGDQLIAGGRIYAQRYTCEGEEDAGIAIVDAPDGKPVRQVTGRWTLANPRTGEAIFPDNDDSCD